MPRRFLPVTRDSDVIRLAKAMTNAGRALASGVGPSALGLVTRVFQTQESGSVAQVEVCCAAGGSSQRSEAMFSARQSGLVGVVRVVPATMSRRKG